MSKLSIWILEDYGTNNKWTLKHTISLRKLSGKTKKQGNISGVNQPTYANMETTNQDH